LRTVKASAALLGEQKYKVLVVNSAKREVLKYSHRSCCNIWGERGYFEVARAQPEAELS